MIILDVYSYLDVNYYLISRRVEVKEIRKITRKKVGPTLHERTKL